MESDTHWSCLQCQQDSNDYRSGTRPPHSEMAEAADGLNAKCSLPRTVRHDCFPPDHIVHASFH